MGLVLLKKGREKGGRLPTMIAAEHQRHLHETVAHTEHPSPHVEQHTTKLLYCRSVASPARQE